MTEALDRRLTLGGAAAVNVLAMIGVGPFVTIPLLLRTMGGPQAMLGWFLGAGIALADGLVWAELGRRSRNLAAAISTCCRLTIRTAPAGS